MSGLDIFAWIVLVVLILTALAGWIILAVLPGKIAKRRKHAHADAVNVAGWVGAIGFGVIWPLALIWAFISPGSQTSQGVEPEEGAT